VNRPAAPTDHGRTVPTIDNEVHQIMRVRVDGAKCQGHTLCAMNAPHVFELSDEDGHAFVTDENVAPQDEAAVRAAYESCPEGAVVLED
jgi:ferredoxin